MTSRNWHCDVAKWRKGGRLKPTHLLDTTLHYMVKPVCGCGHSAAFATLGHWWLFEWRGREDSLYSAHARFWCRATMSCSAGKSRHSPPCCARERRRYQMPRPPEHVWKRVVSRLR